MFVPIRSRRQLHLAMQRPWNKNLFRWPLTSSTLSVSLRLHACCVDRLARSSLSLFKLLRSKQTNTNTLNHQHSSLADLTNHEDLIAARCRRHHLAVRCHRGRHDLSGERAVLRYVLLDPEVRHLHVQRWHLCRNDVHEQDHYVISCTSSTRGPTAADRPSPRLSRQTCAFLKATT